MFGVERMVVAEVATEPLLDISYRPAVHGPRRGRLPGHPEVTLLPAPDVVQTTGHQRTRAGQGWLPGHPEVTLLPAPAVVQTTGHQRTRAGRGWLPGHPEVTLLPAPADGATGTCSGHPRHLLQATLGLCTSKLWTTCIRETTPDLATTHQLETIGSSGG